MSDTKNKLTQPIKWHGGKHYLAPWILSHFPEHTHYVETHFGGGSVLLQRGDFEGVSEVVNDLNHDLTLFWGVMKIPCLFAEFCRIVEATPFSQSVFEAAGESSTRTEVQRAVDFFVRARQSRQGLMKVFATLSRNRTRRGMNEQVSAWLTSLDGLADVHQRLKRVVILNQTAEGVIRKEDGPKTLFYLDPPYLHETRSVTDAYLMEMSDDEHRSLLDLLSSIKGKFILSGYPSALYSEHAKRHGWRCVTKDIDNKSSSSKTKSIKTECLWMNFKGGDA